MRRASGPCPWQANCSNKRMERLEVDKLSCELHLRATRHAALNNPCFRAVGQEPKMFAANDWHHCTQWFRDGWPSLTSGGGFMCPGQICEQHLSCVRVCGRIGPHAYLWNRLPKAPRLLGSCEVEDVSRTAECAEVAKGDAPWLPSLEPEERFDEEFIGSASLCPPSTIRSF